jgi:hypothetical protein
MATIQESIEVAAPVTTAYNQWTQFEEFPSFMQGVKEVRQLDDTHLHGASSTTVSGTSSTPRSRSSGRTSVSRGARRMGNPTPASSRFIGSTTAGAS